MRTGGIQRRLLHDVWPLGKLLYASLITAVLPVHITLPVTS